MSPITQAMILNGVVLFAVLEADLGPHRKIGRFRIEVCIRLRGHAEDLAHVIVDRRVVIDDEDTLVALTNGGKAGSVRHLHWDRQAIRA